MWSTRLLWTGVISAFAVAALMLAGMFVVLLAASGGEHPGLAMIVVFASPGMIVYPACWYAVIFRRRDYSRHQTLKLIGAAYGVVSMIIASSMLVDGLVSMISDPTSKITPLLILILPLEIVAVGTVILGIPYAIVATPMALLHRWLLSKCFTSTNFANPSDQWPSLSPPG
ncbi:hypothetical protein [Bradyrhizobium sp. LTSP857]|uniref:hypothetical protein n=1 Tax=Bradyrhizobium sp. LTSP857 TaxID=1619231 RepID=UPI0005D2C0AC|nr:hypothetical protein [Bradyrhizobium sp. LTSP857]KJC34501.1 hypothetical protein UP06_33820 [Bradyrhizobium sp. LTSP857]